jgi:hypothetical protein
MFWGQPVCPTCGYEGPNFMWSYHHNMGAGVLIQDRESLALRVAWVEDRPDLARAGEDEAGAAWENHAREIASRQLRPNERLVPPGEFLTSDSGYPESATDLPCPVCRATLLWRHTGIS